MNRNIGILFGVVPFSDSAIANVLTMETPITEHSSIEFELRFQPLIRDGRMLAFPCNPQGRVDLDTVSDRTKNDYLFARAMIGRDYAVPVIQQLQRKNARSSAPVY